MAYFALWLKDLYIMADNSDNIKIYNGTAALYQSKAAALKRTKPKYSEGVFRRTKRLIKGLKEVKAEIDAQPYCSAENIRERYEEVFHDAWSPLFDMVHNAADTLWSFLFNLWYDILGVIVFIINMVVKLAYYVASVGIFIWDRFWDLRLWADDRKKTLFQIFAAAVAIVVLGVMTINLLTAYEYSYFGRTLGTVKSKKEVYSTVTLIGDKLSDSTGVDVNLDTERDIEFKRVFGLNFKFDTQDDLLHKLKYMKDIQVTAYALKVDGTEVVILENEAIAKALIEDVKTSFTPKTDGLVYDEVSLGQEITIEAVTVKLGSLWRPDDAAKYLKTGTTSELSEGDVPEPIITVYATGTLTSYEEIGYGTRYVNDDSMYVTDVKQETAGKPGINKITSQVEIVNGVEVARTEESNVTLTQPVDAVYRRGTKEMPATISSSGTWMFPLRGSASLTSPYGYRNGSFHSGNDYYQPYGSPIYAADGGVVIAAGYQGSYGLKVEINHGNGYVTLYAHCSELLVSVGQTVQQGQMIARLGSTGWVTGAHLHFGAYYNGNLIDSRILFQ